MERLKKLGIKVGKIRGPLVYHPYQGGSEFPKIEFKNVKPGFKIWVDGGVLDYPDSTCIAK